MKFDLDDLAQRWIPTYSKAELKGHLLELIQKEMLNRIINRLRIRNEGRIVLQAIVARNFHDRH